MAFIASGVKRGRILRKSLLQVANDHSWHLAEVTGLVYVRLAPIVLKKSKISPRQNSRKSELIAEFGWRCHLKHLRRPLVEFAPIEAVVPHVPKRQAHQRFLENWSRRWIGLFQQNRSSTDLGLFNRDFRFCPVNGHRRSVGPLPKSAKTRPSEAPILCGHRPRVS